MTNKKLQKYLKQFPDDMKVLIPFAFEGTGYEEADGVHLRTVRPDAEDIAVGNYLDSDDFGSVWDEASDSDPIKAICLCRSSDNWHFTDSDGIKKLQQA